MGVYRCGREWGWRGRVLIYPPNKSTILLAKSNGGGSRGKEGEVKVLKE